MTASLAVLEALAVTAELTSTPLSAVAAKVLASDLAPYPEIQVLGALSRCRKELKGRICLAEIIARLDDGRPDPQEAWALCPFDEWKTLVWTEEMAGAWGVALPLIQEDDRVAARMAFLESYRTRVQRARDTGLPVKWCVSFGQGFGYEDRLNDMRGLVSAGKITAARALELGYDVGDVVPAPQIQNMAAALAARLKGGE